MCKIIFKVRDLNSSFTRFDEADFIKNASIDEINLGEGTARIYVNPSQDLFFRIIGETCDTDIKGERDLIEIVRKMHLAKIEYDKIEKALIEVKETGYGLVAPELSEMKLEEPEIVKQGNRYGVN